jgi:hypothetical protein
MTTGIKRGPAVLDDNGDPSATPLALRAYLVDIIPILVYLPSWFPGSGFQKKAAHWRKIIESLVGKPFRYVQEQLVGVHFL